VTRALATLQIGFIVSDGRSPTTGSERYYWDLLRTLPVLDVDVRGLVVGDAERVRATMPQVESFAAEGAPALERVRALRRAVGERVATSDVIVSHHAQHALPVLDRIRRRPLVVHCHGPLVREGRAEGVGAKNLLMRRLAERAVYPRAERIVVLSEANARALREDYRIPDERIRIVPGAVDIARFAPTVTRAEARARLGWPQDRPIVVVVGRLVATKGIEDALDAVAALRSDLPDLLLMVVGTGPLQESLRRRITEGDLTRNVRLVGQLDADLPLAYRAADLSLVPSRAFEGFGLVALEALAAGTPVLVSPIGGLPEVVRELDETLILDAPGPDAIAAAVADALQGRLPLPSSERCAAYAQRFDWPAIAARIRDVYRETLA
jgi:glycosyltransferase involved in cell wall biosynthesis